MGASLEEMGKACALLEAVYRPLPEAASKA